VKKLESGDIRVFAGSGAAKARLLEDQSWIQEQYPSAYPSMPQYQAIVHGVRVAGGINPSQGQALQRIQEENGRLHPSLKVTRASWLKSQKAREGKPIHPLYSLFKVHNRSENWSERGWFTMGHF
jgi:hypothetical protein